MFLDFLCFISSILLWSSYQKLLIWKWMIVRCFPTLTYARWWHLSISNYAYSPDRPILSNTISVAFSLICSSDSFLHGLIQSMTKHARSSYWTLSLSYSSREFLFSDFVSLLSSYFTLFHENNDLVQKLLTGWLKTYWKFIE